MRTGLQSHIDRCAARRLTGLRERYRFSMRPSASLRPSASYDAPIRRNNYAPDSRIGPDITQSTICQTQRVAHMPDVVW